jgi:hypothetical protein
MTSVGNHIKSFFERLSRNEKTRDAERSIRLSRIREKKKEIARDLASGHNVGDFNIDKTDLPLIMFIIQKGYGISMSNLKNLYVRYRGE